MKADESADCAVRCLAESLKFILTIKADERAGCAVKCLANCAIRAFWAFIVKNAFNKTRIWLGYHLTVTGNFDLKRG